MPDQPNAIVLGGTDDHIRLLQLLSQRGYRTTLIDYFPNPPAKLAADVHLQESALDPQKVLEIARNRKADLVISACIDQALPVACYVAEQLGLPSPFSHKTALEVTNKLNMKRRMVDASIPTSPFKEITSVSAIEEIGLRFPLMVKPADSHGSFGVRKVSSPEELKKFAADALRISHSGTAIVEEFRDGLEVSVDAFIGDGDCEVLMLSNLRKKAVGPNINLIFQTLIPPPISPKALERIRSIVAALAKAFGLRNTPLLMQTIVDGDEVNVIEFSPRIGGGSKHKTVKRITGFDILSALIDSFLGLKPKLHSARNGHFYSRNHIYALPGAFGRVEGAERLLADGTIEEFVFYKTRGMEIGENYASKDRVGCFFVSAESEAALTSKIRVAVNSLQVYDLNERPIMRKDIFDGPYL